MNIKKIVPVACRRTLRKSYILHYFQQKLKEAGKQYLFSIIIPVYNCEKYLDETMKSLINQYIGFEHIQVILVNDGSTDKSEEVCQKYANKYKNVIYISQENLGVSAARNRGIEKANGLFINFLDADDKWDEFAFYEVLKYSIKFPKVEIMAAKEMFFDAQTGPHPRNDIFKTDHIVKLEKEFKATPISAVQSFIKYSLIGKTRFNERLKHSEDGCFTAELLLETMEFGAMRAPIYYYRKHLDSGSSSNKITTTMHYYTDAITMYFDYLAQLSKAKKGSIPLFIQNQLAYNLCWRIKDKDALEMSRECLLDYRETLKRVLQYIDDSIIAKQTIIGANLKAYLLTIKYGYDYSSFMKSLVYFENFLVAQYEGHLYCLQYQANRLKRLEIQFITVDSKNDTICIEGLLPSLSIEPELVSVHVISNGDSYNASIYKRKHGSVIYLFDDVSFPQLHFRCTVPLTQYNQVFFEISLANSSFTKVTPQFGKYVPLLGGFRKTTYCILNGYLVYCEGNSLIFNKEYQNQDAQDKERALCQAIRDKGNERYVKIRQKYFASKNKPVKLWLFTDRLTSAEDSGEVMFRYIGEHPVEGVDIAFVIRGDVPDYERLKQYGRVIEYLSEEHFDAMLQADLIITSAADDPVLYPFSEALPFIKDLYHFEFVFLQHGVIKDDLSNWLHRANKNIRLFVASAARERDAIINGPYGYTDKEVILTGLPRFDNFLGADTNKKERAIFIMPTWRQWIAPSFNVKADSVNTIATKRVGFNESDYYKFYNGLLSSPRLNKLLEQYDYDVYFALHPRMGAEMDLFFSNQRIHLLKPESFAYGEAYKKMSMLITDYSSVAFNVALLNKPIVYSQFDYEEFYLSGKHTSTAGYFSFEEDGFGPVVTTIDQVIDEIEKNLNNGFEVEPKYQKRAKEFFYWPENNTPRAKLVLDAILAMEKNKE